MKKVLIASNLGFYSHGMGFDSYLYNLLKENSYEVHMALCDGVMNACQMSKFSRIMPKNLAISGQSEICTNCLQIGEKKLVGINNVIKLSKYLCESKEEGYSKLIENIVDSDIKNYVFKDIKVGENAYASTVRYFANLDFINEKYGVDILKKYLLASIKIADIYTNILETLSPNLVVVHHGIYTPQGIIVEVAKKLNIKILTWIKSYRKDTFLFSWNDSYHHEMQKDSYEYKNIKYSPIIRNTVKNYLNMRRSGESDSIHFNKNPESINLNLFPKKFDLLLTSVFWDAQVHYKNNLFGDQANWIIETIKLYINNANLGNLVIRIHPAEVTGFIESRDKAFDRISKHFNSLPPNIVIIDSNSKLSTYELIDNCESVLIYNTKTGIEASAIGKPVVIAGDSWIKNCDFVLSPKSEEDYINLLISGKHRDFDFDIKDAHKYFYHFYFRKMLEFPCLVESKKDFKYDVSARVGLNEKVMSRSEETLLNALKYNKDVYINRDRYLW
jgi:hypothetical protein